MRIHRDDRGSAEQLIVRGRTIAAWIVFSVLYWFLALAFAMGAMLGGYEPPKSGCSPVTANMVLFYAVVFYGSIVGTAILRRKPPRR